MKHLVQRHVSSSTLSRTCPFSAHLSYLLANMMQVVEGVAKMIGLKLLQRMGVWGHQGKATRMLWLHSKKNSHLWGHSTHSIYDLNGGQAPDPSVTSEFVHHCADFGTGFGRDDGEVLMYWWMSCCQYFSHQTCIFKSSDDPWQPGINSFTFGLSREKVILKVQECGNQSRGDAIWSSGKIYAVSYLQDRCSLCIRKLE